MAAFAMLCLCFVGPVRPAVAAGWSGHPSFNTCSTPTDLAYLDPCITGQVNLFAKALLYPEYTACNQNRCENQSEVGWRIEKLTDGTQAASVAFWGDYYTRLEGLYTGGNTLASGIRHD